MMRARLIAVVACALVWGCEKREPTKVDPPAPPETKAAPEKTPSTADPKKAAPKTAEKPQTPPAAKGGLPAADRVFTADLDGDGIHEILGADKNGLWAAKHDGTIVFRSTGSGVVQRVTMGPDYQGLAERALYVARGMGRGFLQAPLVVQRIDPKTGDATVVWQNTGQRNEAAYLSLEDTNGDGKIELVLGHYASKYMVKVRSWDKSGPVLDAPEVRMASSHTHGDVDGDGKLDHVVGRVYGDARGEPGDLRVELASGPASIPTDKGVKAVLAAKPKGAKHAALFFADGWVANYGKEAKAQLKQATWTDGKLSVKSVGGSPDEFTFFALTAIDVGGDGVMDIVVQGNKRFTVFTPEGETWKARPVGGLGPVLNTAVGKQKDGVYAYVPNAKGVRATKL